MEPSRHENAPQPYLLFPTPAVAGVMVPVDGVPPSEWAAGAARELVATGTVTVAGEDDSATTVTAAATTTSPDAVEQLASRLAEWANYCRGTGCTAAFVCLAHDGQGVYALLEWDLLTGDDGDGGDSPKGAGPSLDRLAEIYGTMQPDMLHPPDIGLVDLGQGTAVRVHAFRSPASGQPGDGWPRLVEEKVTFAVPFPGTGAAAAVTGSWPSVATGDELFALVEDVAGEMRVGTDDGPTDTP